MDASRYARHHLTGHALLHTWLLHASDHIRRWCRTASLGRAHGLRILAIHGELRISSHGSIGTLTSTHLLPPSNLQGHNLLWW